MGKKKTAYMIIRPLVSGASVRQRAGAFPQEPGEAAKVVGIDCVGDPNKPSVAYTLRFSGGGDRR